MGRDETVTAGRSGLDVPVDYCLQDRDLKKTETRWRLDLLDWIF